ncbi:MAG: hypothetical protein WC069_06630 [Candidatus Shapirobacteria bacterium]
MAGYVMNMSILVSNINRCWQKDLSSEVRHKAYASRCVPPKKTQNESNI